MVMMMMISVALSSKTTGTHNNKPKQMSYYKAKCTKFDFAWVCSISWDP